MTDHATAGLKIDPALARFTTQELLPGTGLSPETFWSGLAQLVTDFAPRHARALARRADLQARIDAWHIARRGSPHDPAAYRAFLSEIGYLEPDGPDFTIETTGTDPEIATLAGPQLVVPVMNARFALNAANARWGSLYDALYGSDALGSLPKAPGYDPARGAQVIAWAKAFLDDSVPLEGAAHGDVTGYRIAQGHLIARTRDTDHPLADPAQFVGHTGPEDTPRTVILRRNGLHLILDLDPAHPIGRTDPAGMADLRLESALSAIMDCEDSVAAVDGPDKAAVYRNWLGLMTGTLEESFDKGGQRLTRRLAGDIAYTAPDGRPARLKGRALMFVRNVGHLMTTPAVRDASDAEIPEGILDALFTVTAALHDLRGARANSAASVYIVKPKMHGSDEVRLTDDLFTAIEDLLSLPRHTVKLGIMDEERRSSANLRACLRAARHRVAFVNTGFLDRTGDEIHSSMEAGPMRRKPAMKDARWLAAYEDRNVDIALACGFQGRGQIGKGMWAMPDRMAAMLEAKIAHPLSGADCAWVPSPTAATLHATHYHRVDVAARQNEIRAAGPRATLEDLLDIPLAPDNGYPPEEIEAEILNNAQGILGYVTRWVEQGIGCSKVPDIDDIGQMEDRATCRISAQMLANWLHHGIVSPDQVTAALHRAAQIVDRQNAGDPAYRPIGDGSASHAFAAAHALIFEGRQQPSGYTEPVLHAARARFKAETGL